MAGLVPAIAISTTGGKKNPDPVTMRLVPRAYPTSSNALPCSTGR